ncbi:MAG: glycosyl transferase family 1 [Candidatus Bipolaricaulis sibiricus]|uniref:Glycosyl transferase family 1 n=1 Tax=Bipolaricaulis sibiricus TaxID=2501609 RepID=A0A410FTJ2_BIPS1|nr:MAG: glycosyl transferase family 1 [Candidatus Bipolaricaulis sibiricus]
MGKNVCILTTVHPPFDTRIFHKEAKTLVRAGHDVTLIAQHDKNEVVDGVQIIALPKPKNRFTRIFGLAWRAFRLALRQRADIYHFHDPELLLAGGLLKMLTRAKVIYDVHEDVPEQILTKHWLPALLRHPLAVVFNAFEKFLSRALDAVVVATEGIAEKFRGLNPVVIHNYPDLRMLPDLSPVPKEGKEKTLVYVGGISKLRGALEMVRALEYLDHVDGLRLDLIGRFEPPELERELQALPGYRRVRFLGWLQPPEVYGHLKEADIGLVCLHPEPRYVVAWPVKLFEYMAAGLPVVASNFPLWKEIVGGNNCGLCVDPLDPKAIAQAIEYLLTHPEEARRMGEHGRQAVREKYNWEKESEKLLALYAELLS